MNLPGIGLRNDIPILFLMYYLNLPEKKLEAKFIIPPNQEDDEFNIPVPPKR